MNIPIRKITIGEDKDIKIVKRSKDSNGLEILDKDEEDRMMKYRSLFLLIKFLKYNPVFELNYRPWHDAYIRNTLADLEGIGIGILSYKDLEDKECCEVGRDGKTKKFMIKRILVRISPRLEK